MNVNDKILDGLIAHQVFIERYKNDRIRKIQKAITKKDKKIRQMLFGEYDVDKRRSLNKIIRELDKINKEAYKKIKSDIVSENIKFGKQEQKSQLEVIRGSLDGLRDDYALTAPMEKVLLEKDDVGSQANVLITGFTINEVINRLELADTNRAKASIRNAYIEESELDSLLRELFGTASNRYQDGLSRVTNAQTASVVATVIQAVSDKAMLTIASANSRLIKGLKYVAILDSKTTPICQSRSGRIYHIDKHPVIPAHMNCRSRYVPVFRGIGSPEDMTFSSWLRKQSVDVQEDTLGVKRAKLFRNGGLVNPLRSFFSEVKRKPLTLDELRVKYSENWKKAGLS